MTDGEQLSGFALSAQWLILQAADFITGYPWPAEFGAMSMRTIAAAVLSALMLSGCATMIPGDYPAGLDQHGPYWRDGDHVDRPELRVSMPV